MWLWLTYIVYWSPFFTFISFHFKQTLGGGCVYIIETRESLHNSLLTSFVSSWILPSSQILSSPRRFSSWPVFLFLRCKIKACHPLSNDYLIKILQAQSPEGKMDYNIKVWGILAAGLCLLFWWRRLQNYYTKKSIIIDIRYLLYIGRRVKLDSLYHFWRIAPPWNLEGRLYTFSEIGMNKNKQHQHRYTNLLR